MLLFNWDFPILRSNRNNQTTGADFERENMNDVVWEVEGNDNEAFWKTFFSTEVDDYSKPTVWTIPLDRNAKQLKGREKGRENVLRKICFLCILIEEKRDL